MCHSRRAIGPTTRRVLRCAAPAPEALTDITREDSRAGSKAVLPCDLLRLVVDGRHCSESAVGDGGVPRTWDLVVAVGRSASCAEEPGTWPFGRPADGRSVADAPGLSQ